MATQPMPHHQLVEVFDTMDESEAMVVRGLLESFGIPALVSGLDAPQDVLPGVGGVIVRVPEERAMEARQIITENRARSEAIAARKTAMPEQPEQK